MSAADAYIESQVLTATPQKLRLLLIGGAIRFAHAAAQFWKEERDADALEAVIRCRAIVAELLTVVRRGEFEPAEDVIALYVHLFQELTLAQSRRDAQKLRDVIRVLEEERETWRLVCEQAPDPPTPLLEQGPQEVTHADAPSEAAPMRFSLDA